MQNFTERKDWRKGYANGRVTALQENCQGVPHPRVNPYNRADCRDAWDLGFQAGYNDHKIYDPNLLPAGLRRA